jgi:hypothetical protein
MPREDMSRGDMAHCGLHLVLYGSAETARARSKKALLEHTNASKNLCSALQSVSLMGEELERTQPPFPNTSG